MNGYMRHKLWSPRVVASFRLKGPEISIVCSELSLAYSAHAERDNESYCFVRIATSPIIRRYYGKENYFLCIDLVQKQSAVLNSATQDAMP